MVRSAFIEHLLYASVYTRHWLRTWLDIVLPSPSRVKTRGMSCGCMILGKLPNFSVPVCPSVKWYLFQRLW